MLYMIYLNSIVDTKSNTQNDNEVNNIVPDMQPSEIKTPKSKSGRPVNVHQFFPELELKRSRIPSDTESDDLNYIKQHENDPKLMQETIDEMEFDDAKEGIFRFRMRGVRNKRIL